MHDDVQEDLLEHELEGPHLCRIEGHGRSKIPQELVEHGELRSIGRDGRASRGHVRPCCACASADARSACTGMIRLKPLSSKTSRTAGCSAHSENAIPERCAARAVSRNARRPALETYSSRAPSTITAPGGFPAPPNARSTAS